MEVVNVEGAGSEQDDLYEQHCGEVFFTLKGNVIFYCTLCEYRYKCCTEYLTHLKEHYQDFVFASDHEDNECDYEIVEETADSHEILNSYENIDIEVCIERNEKGDGEDEDQFQNEIAEIQDDDTDESEKSITEEKAVTTAKLKSRKITNRKAAKPTERKFECHICGFAFTQIFNLRAHIRRHSNEKRFKCTQCPKAFHTRTEQETHMRRHKGERPFICEECGQTFVTAGSLTMHVKRHKNLRNHECNHCQKRFFDTHALKIHLAGHTGDRPFNCDLCNTSFSRKKALAVHKKIHENKREYQCEYCSSSFNQKPGLYSHMKIKHSNIGDTR